MNATMSENSSTWLIRVQIVNDSIAAATLPDGSTTANAARKVGSSTDVTVNTAPVVTIASAAAEAGGC